MKNIAGEITKYGNLYHFRPYGWSIWFFWSSLYKKWLRCNGDDIDTFWHRHLPGKVDISKLMIR